MTMESWQQQQQDEDDEVEAMSTIVMPTVNNVSGRTAKLAGLSDQQEPFVPCNDMLAIGSVWGSNTRSLKCIDLKPINVRLDEDQTALLP